MNPLAEILSSRIRAEVFRLLFVEPGAECYVREIERRTGFNDRAIRQELAKLTRLGLVAGRRDGNRLYYRACRDHPLYADLRNLTIKTSGLVDVLRDCLNTETVQLAFVFGSVADGSARPDSDIDLMVIGQVKMRGLSRMLRGASERLGREINPHTLTPEEFRKRLHAREHFLSTILAQPKLMVKGVEDDLNRLGA